MHELQRVLGRRIQELRQQKRLSQEQLAHESGLHRTYVGLIERGQRNATVSILEKIAGALGVPASELFAGVEARPAARNNTGRSRPAIASVDVVAQLSAIRDILIESKLVDAAAYAKRVERYRSRKE